MKQKIILLFVLVVFSYSAKSQDVTEWQGKIEGVFYARNGAQFHLNGQSFSIAAGNQWREHSYLGEKISELQIASGPNYSFFAAPFPDGIFSIQKSFFGSASAIYLRFTYFDGLGFDASLPDAVGITNLKGPACLEISPGEYAIFGRQFFRKISVNPALQEINVDWETDKYGRIRFMSTSPLVQSKQIQPT